MSADNLPCDSEAKAEAMPVERGARATIEALENAPDIGGADADALVFDLDEGFRP
jgi:hypothetical protein